MLVHQGIHTRFAALLLGHKSARHSCKTNSLKQTCVLLDTDSGSMQIDWDYHMRLAQQGTPGLDPSAGSIIHFYHFRRWRESGIAYELRDCKYSEVNRTLLSTAYGSRKEYKDRLAFITSMLSCAVGLSLTALLAKQYTAAALLPPVRSGS